MATCSRVRCFQIVTMSLACAVAGGCLERDREAIPYTVTAIDKNGAVLLADGRTFRLAGLKMRAIGSETEPDILEAAKKIVNSSRTKILVETDADGTGVLFYDQPVKLRDRYWRTPLSPPETARCTLNELVIVLGAAEYDSATVPSTLAALAPRMKDVQERADLAKWNKRRYIPLERCISDPSILYDELTDGFRPRLTEPDQKKQEDKWRESEDRTAVLSRLKANPAEFAAAIRGDLGSDNRAVRRAAAWELRTAELRDPELRAAMIGALRDEDPFIRQWIAEALGASCATEAESDLERLSQGDANPKVRESAKAALDRLRQR